MVRSLGADHVIDYTQQDFTRTGQHYDLILEMAGNRSLAELRRALPPKGTLVLVGGSGGRWFMGTGRTLRAVVVSPILGQRLRSFLSKPRGAGLVVLRELIEVGKLTPVIDRTFALSETPGAIGYVGERSTQGKTVITVVSAGRPDTVGATVMGSVGGGRHGLWRSRAVLLLAVQVRRRRVHQKQNPASRTAMAMKMPVSVHWRGQKWSAGW
jgi:hypothetical protein